MQQHRVLKQLAMAYAIKFVGRYMLDRFKTMEGLDTPPTPTHTHTHVLTFTRGCTAGNDASGAIAVPPDLSEIAATSAGLKGVTTALAAAGIEDCRECCGGNG